MARLASFIDPATGVRFQPVRARHVRDDGSVGRVLPFAEELVKAWTARDGVDRRLLLRGRAFNVPEATYHALVPAVRAALDARMGEHAGVFEEARS